MRLSKCLLALENVKPRTSADKPKMAAAKESRTIALSEVRRRYLPMSQPMLKK
jgi:hypothetical protein